jgi:hypothetical protein
MTGAVNSAIISFKIIKGVMLNILYFKTNKVFEKIIVFYSTTNERVTVLKKRL